MKIISVKNGCSNGLIITCIKKIEILFFIFLFRDFHNYLQTIPYTESSSATFESYIPTDCPPGNASDISDRTNNKNLVTTTFSGNKLEILFQTKTNSLMLQNPNRNKLLGFELINMILKNSKTPTNIYIPM